MAGLNRAQREAVEHREGPLLVLAGAGSGKTRVITHRIGRLTETVRPEAILAVSFTNKAAAEMGERMIPLVGREKAAKLWLSTFHSFGVRFLSEEVEALGYPSRFTIFDQGDAIGTVREIVRREGIADRTLDLWAVHARISLWKNQGLAPDEVHVGDFEYDAVAKSVYPHYEASLRNMCAVDFDDLVLLPVRVLKTREKIRDKWRNRFRHLLVDEFQDTNKVQLDLVKLLTNELRNVCVVGDDDQSIYGWRGADVANILEFEHHFAGAKIVKLEDNYRSRAPILEVANAAIARSKRKRHEKVLRAAKTGGDKVRLCVVPDAEAEAKFVAMEVRDLRKNGVRLKDIAVLYRSNLQARPIEEELRVNGIPYRVFGGTQFFDRKEVKDAVAYLRVVVAPKDELSLRRVLNYPARGIGDTTIERIQRWAVANDRSFHDALARIEAFDDIPDGAKRGVRSFFAAIQQARERFATGSGLAAAATQLFTEVGLDRALREEEKKQADKRWLNVEHVIRSLAKYEAKAPREKNALASFLMLLTMRIEEEAEEAGEMVTLSSLHAAKGLEFDAVFLIGLNEGQLPHSRTTDPKATEAAPSDVEEERRLFYVGVTRARERLYLTRPTRRSMRGKVSPLIATRFLEGLPEDHLELYERNDDAPISSDEAVTIGKAFLAQLRGGS